VEIVGECFYGADKFGSSFFGCKDVGAGFATAPAAEGEDDLEFRMGLFECYQFLDSGGISGVADKELVPVQVAEAKDDMG
jgi:hypothetical protein